MKRSFLILIAGTLLLALGVASVQALRRESREQSPIAKAIYDFYGADAAHQALYVGSETCLSCHSGPNAVHGYDTSGWRDSFHARPYKEVANDRYSMVVGKGIVADSDQNGVDDFKDGLDMNSHPVFSAYAPNAPVLGYSDEGGYTVKIGGGTFKVFFAWGGNGLYKQRFVTEIPVTDRASGISAGKYIMPIQYNEVTHAWVAYHPENWYDENKQPHFGPDTTSAIAASKGRSFDKKCTGCHFTATSVSQDSLGEYVSVGPPAVLLDPDDPTYIDFNRDGIKEMTHIGCESCHGPGSVHVIGHGDPTVIVKPDEDFNAQQANEACGRCHARGASSDGTYGYPYDEIEDHDYILGDDLTKYFQDKPGLWPDGKTSRQHHQQFEDLYQSSKPTFQFHMVVCQECHDVHKANKHNMRTSITEEEDGEVFDIAVENDNNTLCLACHATHGAFEAISKKMVAEYEQNEDSIAKVVEAHTRHSYAPDRKLGLSRCSKCHMPKTAKSAINYDIHSHTFETISPQKTLMYQEQGGMPNSCSVSCHRNIVDIFPNGVDPNIGTWTEQSDIDLANWLMGYYGPDGKWWKHDENPPESTATEISGVRKK